MQTNKTITWKFVKAKQCDGTDDEYQSGFDVDVQVTRFNSKAEYVVWDYRNGGFVMYPKAYESLTQAKAFAEDLIQKEGV